MLGGVSRPEAVASSTASVVMEPVAKGETPVTTGKRCYAKFGERWPWLVDDIKTAVVGPVVKIRAAVTTAVAS